MVASSGSLQFSVTWPLPGVAVKPVGAAGGGGAVVVPDGEGEDVAVGPAGSRGPNPQLQGFVILNRCIAQNADLDRAAPSARVKCESIGPNQGCKGGITCQLTPAHVGICRDRVGTCGGQGRRRRLSRTGGIEAECHAHSARRRRLGEGDGNGDVLAAGIALVDRRRVGRQGDGLGGSGIVVHDGEGPSWPWSQPTPRGPLM